MLKAIRAFLDLLFPIFCIGCEKDNIPICEICLAQIKLPLVQSCPGCGKPAVCGKCCPACSCGNPLDGLLVAFIYKKGGSLARMLHLYKYERISAYGHELSALLAWRVSADFLEFIGNNIDYITWVPLSPKKFRIRGFNQTEKLAAGLPIQIPKIALLDKIRESRSQMQLKRRERLTNVTDSFRIKPGYESALIGKNILIVDDVATTLATLTEMAGVLKAAGANSVYGLVLARQQE